MAGLPKALQALDQHLLDRNREHLKPAARWSPTAPMPETPGICRWCGGTLRALIDEDGAITYCQNSCALNRHAPYVGQCHECGREFETGKQGATLCHPCDQAEAKRIAETGAVHPYRTYRFERFKRGGFRE